MKNLKNINKYFKKVEMIHSDPRRDLIEWFSNKNIKISSIKCIITKKRCELGNHYSKRATEFFYLLKGEIQELRLKNIKNNKSFDHICFAIYDTSKDESLLNIFKTILIS